MIVFHCLKTLYYTRIKTTVVVLIKTMEVLLNEEKQFCSNDLGNSEWLLSRNGMHLSLGLYLAVLVFYLDLSHGLYGVKERKTPIKFSGKTVLTVIAGIVGALALGIGMCFSMVWRKMVSGIVIGLVGIVILLFLIPLTKGIKK